MSEYKVQLNVFEGPLDLLLYLIKKEEVDIYEVNLTKIATQFIEYVEMMRRLDLDVAGEFLVMAATLMYIKSRELLPVDQQVKVEEDEDAIDPRWDLIRQLVEYKKFKDIASKLHGREQEMDSVYGRQPGQLELPAPEADLGKGVSLLDLIQAVSSILKRFKETEKPGTISEDKWSVSEKIQLLVDMLEKQPVVRFSELFAAARGRSEVIVTFLAMLELTRMKKIWLAQSEVFGEIEVSAAPPESAIAEKATNAEAVADQDMRNATEKPSAAKKRLAAQLKAEAEAEEESGENEELENALGVEAEDVPTEIISRGDAETRSQDLEVEEEAVLTETHEVDPAVANPAAHPLVSEELDPEKEEDTLDEPTPQNAVEEAPLPSDPIVTPEPSPLEAPPTSEPLPSLPASAAPDPLPTPPEIPAPAPAPKETSDESPQPE